MSIYDRAGWLNRWAHRMMTQAMRLAYGRQLAELRKKRGLPPRPDMLDVLMGSDDVLLASDREYAGAPTDSSLPCIELASFVYPDSGALSPELEAFLNAGDKPIYLGFGSMADQDREATREMVEVITKELGVRAVLCQPESNGESTSSDGSSHVCVVSSAPHSLLLPRVSVAIHHGGSGTTAAAARAGVPQVIVPHFFDQFFFANRLRRHGVAPRPLPRWRLTANRLKAAIQQVLHDPSYRSAAQRLEQSVRTRNGIEMAVEYLEARHGVCSA
jgi:UDP:flavonoid glycosyltransferase YjiC (YdhE family)